MLTSEYRESNIIDQFYFSCVPLSLICHSTTIVRNKEVIHVQANKNSEKKMCFYNFKELYDEFCFTQKVKTESFIYMIIDRLIYNVLFNRFDR